MIVRIVVSSFALAFSGMAFAQDSAPQAQDAQPAQEARVVEGDTLLIERVQQENKSAMPARGMTMQQVEAQFGAPASKLDPRGGQKKQWPTINRWTYPTFTVYFEKSRVVDAVAIKADANEVGPKPAIR
ncbi:hypothetical protein [Noviluteimonas lactosilytica]|uniref:hypothetical protein n=1 Tax=Noviluteimonas lactosilytica TaxID=2888523 RepID=UPI003CCCC256